MSQIDTLVNKLNTSRNPDAIISMLAENAEDLCESKIFFKLPIENILLVVNKIEASSVDNFVEVAKSIIRKTIRAHPRDPSTLLLLSAFHCNNLGLDLNELMDILSCFEGSDILSEATQLFKEDAGLIMRDPDY